MTRKYIHADTHMHMHMFIHTQRITIAATLPTGKKKMEKMKIKEAFSYRFKRKK